MKSKSQQTIDRYVVFTNTSLLMPRILHESLFYRLVWAGSRSGKIKRRKSNSKKIAIFLIATISDVSVSYLS